MQTFRVACGAVLVAGRTANSCTLTLSEPRSCEAKAKHRAHTKSAVRNKTAKQLQRVEATSRSSKQGPMYWLRVGNARTHVCVCVCVCVCGLSLFFLSFCL